MFKSFLTCQLCQFCQFLSVCQFLFVCEFVMSVCNVLCVHYSLCLGLKVQVKVKSAESKCVKVNEGVK